MSRKMIFRRNKRTLLAMTAASLSLMPMAVYANSSAATDIRSVIVETKTSQVSGTGSDSKAAPQAKITKEQAVAVVKALFPKLEKAETRRVELGNNHTFPAPYQNVWEIQWEFNTANGSTGFNSQVDSLTGDLLQMHLPFRHEEENKAFYPPKVSEQEALELAKTFILKASPGLKEADFKLTDQSKWNEGSLFGPVQYNFNFSLMAGGVPSPNEGIWLTVDGNGEIVGYNRNKIAAEYPSSTPSVSLEKASEAYMSKLDLLLQYMPDNSPNGRNKKWFLGWSPSQMGGLSIDAQTGEFLNNFGDVIKPEQVLYKPVKKTSSVFTPVKGLGEDGQLTEEQAAAIAEQQMPVLKKRTRAWSNLNPYWNDKNKKVWNINWTVETPTDRYGGPQTNAVIDASTGQLLELRENIMMPPVPQAKTEQASQNDQKDAITEQAAEEKAIALLNELYPNASEELQRLTPDLQTIPSGAEKQFTFRFQRFLGEIPILGDFTTVTLDKAGQLISYSSMRSSGLEEQAAKLKANVTKEQALVAFLKEMKLELQYKSFGGFYTNNRYAEPKLKLAYGTAMQDDKRMRLMLDASTGEWRSWGGITGDKSGAGKTIPDDIAGHWAQQDLETLVLHGILQPNEHGALFPDEEIKVGDWINMVAKAAFPYYNEGYYGDPSAKPVFEDVEESSPYYGAVQLFVRSQWLDSKPGSRLGAQDSLTREKLAVLIVSMLKYDKLAEQVGVNAELPFADRSEIKERGAVWIVSQLGLLGGQQEKFNPQGTVTKAQAASVLMRIVYLQGKLDQPIVN